MKRFKYIVSTINPFIFYLGAILYGPLLLGQDGSALTLTGRWSEGECYAVAGQNDMAYYSNGATLVIADLSDPDHPETLSSLTLEGLIQGIALQNDLIYVVGDNGYLEVIDVTSPALPVKTGYLDLPRSTKIVIDGNYAYISGGDLWIVDISTPGSPFVIGTGVGNSTVNSICISGDYAFAATGVGMAVFNISSKTNPFLVHGIDLGQFSRGIEYHDGLVILAAVNQGVVIFDVSDPENPFIPSTYDPGGDAEDVMYHNGFLFVANRYAGMYILDISDPSNPVEKGKVSTARAASLFVDQDVAYIADTWQMTVVTIANIDTPVIKVVLDVGDVIRKIAVGHDHMYLANNYDGMKTLSIQDIQHPRVTSYFEDSHASYDVAIRDTFLFLADDDAGLMILTLSNPDTPTLLVQFPIGQYFNQLALNGNYLYGRTPQGVIILDIHDMAAPAIIGNIDLGLRPDNIRSSGNHLFVCAGYDGMWIYDISDPSMPEQISWVEPVSRILDIATSGLYGYMAEGHDGLTVLDLSNPSQPVRIGTMPLPGYSCMVRTRGNFTYVVSWPLGLHVVDITDHQMPQWGAMYASTSDFDDIALAGNHIFLSEEEDGIFILTFDSLAVAVHEPPGNTVETPVPLAASPNPFTGRVTFDYTVETPCQVRAYMTHETGQVMETLINRHQPAGRYTLYWNAGNRNHLPGTYYLKMYQGKKEYTMGLVRLE